MKKTAESKNILFLISSLSNGGAERVTVNLANSLCHRHKVTIAYFNEKQPHYPVNLDMITLIKIPQNDVVSEANGLFKYIRELPEDLWLRKQLKELYHFLFASKQVKFLRKIKKELKPDVTVSMLEMPNKVNALCPGGVRIMSERNDPSGKPAGYYKNALKSFRKGDWVIFQTEAVKQMFPRSIRQKGIVIKNPVSVEKIKYQPDSKKIVSIGRLSLQKNYPMLLNAFAVFHREHQDNKLHIYGEGPERDNLMDMIKCLNMENCVILEGFVSDIHRQIEDAVAFVMSSDYEGLPNALMEAMMMGIPVITTRCNGAREIVTDGRNGLSVQIGQSEEMAKAMACMIDDRDLRLRLREQAMADAEEFRTERVVAEWEAVLCADKKSIM